MSKGIVYYTDNRCEERIAQVVRAQLRMCARIHDLDIVSVSHYPIDFGRNIVVDLESSVLSMFKQNLIGLHSSRADVVFFCEHDVLYHPSHFELLPYRDAYYFNTNVWTVDARNGEALYYEHKCPGRMMVSGLFGDRMVLLDHYRRRVPRVEEDGWHRHMGFEPGKPLPRGFDDVPRKCLRSTHPNIDIKHTTNITPARFRLSQYRCREEIKDSWVISDRVPGWGETQGRFEKFLREVNETAVSHMAQTGLPCRSNIDRASATVGS